MNNNLKQFYMYIVCNTCKEYTRLKTNLPAMVEFIVCHDSSEGVEHILQIFDAVKLPQDYKEIL